MTTDEHQKLRNHQALGEKVREKMMDRLLHFIPVRELKVADVQVIAEIARELAFDALREDSE